MSTAFPGSQVASGVAIKARFQQFNAGAAVALPIVIALFAQGNTASTYGTDKRVISSAQDVATVEGYGSPAHLAALELFAADGLEGIPVELYPLADGTTPAAGDITPSGAVTKAGTFYVLVNGMRGQAFTVAVGDNVAAIVAAMAASVAGATLSLPITGADNTTDLVVTAKTGGTFGNSIVLGIEGPTDTGVSFAFTQPTGGAGDPATTGALAQLGDDWTPFILNGLGADTTELDRIQATGEGRWSGAVRKPFVAFFGNTDAAVATAITVPDARSSDRVNCQLAAPGSISHPIQVAAAQLAKIANVANTNPPGGYQGRVLNARIKPGVPIDQWDNDDQNAAILGGSSTSVVKGGQITIRDVVTCYHPAGEEPAPPYRYVNDLVKVFNIIHGMANIFDRPEWDGVPLVSNATQTDNPTAKKPQQAESAVSKLADNLAAAAVITEPTFTQETVAVSIDSANPKRLNFTTKWKVSGNTNVRAIDLFFGFQLG